MAFPDTDVSIIICTRDRPGPLLRCLASIAAAVARFSDTAVEIIVLENGSFEALKLDEKLVCQAGGTVTRLVRLPSGGLSQARNHGMALAKGQTLVFTDDDCIMHEDYLRDLVQHVADMPGDMFIGGRVKLADPTDAEFTIKDVPVRELFQRHIHPGGFLQGCNLVIARETAAKIGEFDTRFGAGSPLKAGEDTDYIIRAHIAGICIEYVPDMCVFHQHGRKQIRQIQDLNSQYAFANGAIYAKYMLSQPWLLRHFYWTARAAMRERFFDGPKFHDGLDLTWRLLLKNHLLGFAKFMEYSRPSLRRLLHRNST